MRPATIQGGEVLKPSESGSEKALENLRTKHSMTYARKLRTRERDKEKKLDGQVKSPSSAQSSLRIALNSMRTTRNGGTTSTTWWVNTTFCS